jgi:hypothetical protein
MTEVQRKMQKENVVSERWVFSIVEENIELKETIGSSSM